MTYILNWIISIKNKEILSSRLFVLRARHRGHGLEVEQVPDGLPHAKDILHMSYNQDYFWTSAHTSFSISPTLSILWTGVNFINIYTYKCNQRNPFFQVYVHWNWHGGHGLKVRQVLHVVQHTKDILHMGLHQTGLGKKSGHKQNRKQCINIQMTLFLIKNSQFHHFQW